MDSEFDVAIEVEKASIYQKDESDTSIKSAAHNASNNSTNNHFQEEETGEDKEGRTEASRINLANAASELLAYKSRFKKRNREQLNYNVMCRCMTCPMCRCLCIKKKKKAPPAPKNCVVCDAQPKRYSHIFESDYDDEFVQENGNEAPSQSRPLKVCDEKLKEGMSEDEMDSISETDSYYYTFDGGADSVCSCMTCARCGCTCNGVRPLPKEFSYLFGRADDSFSYETSEDEEETTDDERHKKNQVDDNKKPFK